MLYTAQQMKASALDEATALLEKASYLSDSEARYYPEMVPVRENTRLGKNVIRLEDLNEYVLANGIADGSVALQQICEASGIKRDTVVFSVDEVSVLEDAMMEETVRLIKQDSGMEVYAAPVSEADMASILAESVGELMVTNIGAGQDQYADALFEAFVNDDFESLFNEGTLAVKVKNKIAASATGQKIKATASDVASKVESAMKQAATQSRKWIAKKISAFRTLIDKFTKKGEYEPGVKGIINKVIAKIKQAIEYLSGLLRGDR